MLGRVDVIPAWALQPGRTRWAGGGRIAFVHPFDIIAWEHPFDPVGRLDAVREKLEERGRELLGRAELRAENRERRWRA
jgi:hypothetical protein